MATLGTLQRTAKGGQLSAIPVSPLAAKTSFTVSGRKSGTVTVYVVPYNNENVRKLPTFDTAAELQTYLEDNAEAIDNNTVDLSANFAKRTFSVIDRRILAVVIDDRANSGATDLTIGTDQYA